MAPMSIFQAIRNLVVSVGNLVSCLTVPGTAVHELSHQMACKVVGYTVTEVKYVVVGNPNYAGYVQYQANAPHVLKETLVALAPAPGCMLTFLLCLFVLNTVLEPILPANQSVGAAQEPWVFHAFGIFGWLPVAGLLLLGMNAMMHAIPSPQDLKNVFRKGVSPWYWNFPCWIVVGPWFLLSYSYRLQLWGWHPWKAAVFLLTTYLAFRIVT